MTVTAQTGPGAHHAERVRPRQLTPLDSQQLEPRTLAACAAALLLIDDARSYGLIGGGPEIDRERCDFILRQLKLSGIAPTADEAEAKAIELMAELGALR